MSVRDNAALLQFNDALRPNDDDGSGALDVAGLTYGGLYLEHVGVGRRDLNLGLTSCRAEHSYVLDGTEGGADEGEGLLARVLTGLGKILEGSELISLAEEGLNVRFGEVDVSVGYADGNLVARAVLTALADGTAAALLFLLDIFDDFLNDVFDLLCQKVFHSISFL